jgi:hypothetical protein
MQAELSGGKLSAKMASLGINQNTLAAVTPVASSILSLWRNDLKKPSAKVMQKVWRTIELLELLCRLHPGVKIDMRDIRYLRTEIRKMKGGGGSGKPIPQVHGRRFIVELCSHAHFEPTEFCDKSRLALRVADAEIVSGVAQRWIRAIATSVAGILASKNETFADYVQRYPDRNAALEDLFRRAFEALESEVGIDQVRRYEAALALTGEAAGSPVDVGIN